MENSQRSNLRANIKKTDSVEESFSAPVFIQEGQSQPVTVDFEDFQKHCAALKKENKAHLIPMIRYDKVTAQKRYAHLQSSHSAMGVAAFWASHVSLLVALESREQDAALKQTKAMLLCGTYCYAFTVIVLLLSKNFTAKDPIHPSHSPLLALTVILALLIKVTVLPSYRSAEAALNHIHEQIEAVNKILNLKKIEGHTEVLAPHADNTLDESLNPIQPQFKS